MKKRIAIFGMGGVGGYMAGFLAKQYPIADENVEIIFIARGAHYKAMAENGLEIKSAIDSFNAKATIVTDDTTKVGVVDYIIYTTKSYDVVASVPQLLPMIGPSTVVVPFMNGVDGEELLRENLPGTTVWSGCAIIVSYIESPGVVRQDGNNVKLMFGHKDGEKDRLLELDAIFAATPISVKYHKDIEARVYTKFHLISSMATLTTYTGQTNGTIMATPELRETMRAMMVESLAVFEADSRTLIDDVIEKNLITTELTPGDSTSSMQRDFVAGRRCEVEALCGYIVRLGEKVGVATPLFSKMYEEIKRRINENN